MAKAFRLNFTRILLCLIIFAFLLRLYKITNPVADWHEFRQADTASVSREYVKHGVNFLRPKYQDLSNIQSGILNNGKDNVEGWRMVEFPLVNGLLAYLLRVVPSLDLVLVSRLASVLVSLVSLWCLTRITQVVLGDKVALATAFFFAVLPYSIYYSRVILPEPFFIALSLASLYAYLRFLETKGWRYLFFSVGLFAVALLLKPMAIFFAPVFLGIRWRQKIEITARDFASLVLFSLSFIPLLLWRRWIQNYKIGIPYSDWLYNGGNQVGSPVYHIRFAPAWWRWIFYERLTKLFLGFTGVITFLCGFVAAFLPAKQGKLGRVIFLLSWAVGALAYVSVFASGNVQHDYYQAPLVPMVSVALGLGITFIYELVSRRISPFGGAIVAILLVGTSLIFAWKQVAGYYNINNPAIIEAGKTADKLLPPDAKVIAPYMGDTAFLFQTNRTGWPIGFDIDKKIAEGAGYYVNVNYDDEANALMKKYTVVTATKNYVIIDLTRPVKSSK